MKPALHRWAGALAGPLVLVAAGTALVLNHQDLVRRAPAAARADDPYAGYMLALLADPADPRRLYAGTATGLYRSADGGRTWKACAAAPQVVALAAASGTPPGTPPGTPGAILAAARTAGLFRSADRGATWKPVALPFDPAETPIHGLTTTPAGAVLLTEAGVYRQAAGGWTLGAAAPAKPGPDPVRRFLQVAYDLHDGRFWGRWGVWVTDAAALAMLVLVGTGYPLLFRRRKQGRA